jgi:choline dehydrogenase-like flavoprotein
MANGPAEITIVGSGVAGMLLARELVREGREVLMIERGAFRDHADQLREDAAHGGHGEEVQIPTSEHNTESSYPWDYDYGVGGSGLHWTGVTPRLKPTDFELRSRYGVGRDWPFGYQELEPFYEEAEHVLAVAGDRRTPFPRRTGYRLPAHPFSPLDKLLAPHLQPFYALPQARPTRPVDGRPACCGSARCRLCPVDARYSPLQTFERDVRGKPGFTLRERTIVERVKVSGSRAVSLQLVDSDGKRSTLPVRTVVLSANGIENPAILMRSGLGGGEVGKQIYDHDELVMRYTVNRPLPNGYGTTLSTGVSYAYADGPFRSRRSGIIVSPYNPGILVREQLAEALERGRSGKKLRADLLNLFQHTLVLAASGEDLPRQDRFVSLSPHKDRFGIPLNRVNYPPESSYLTDSQQFVQRDIERRLSSFGARLERLEHVQGGHLIGTCRMGKTDGVVDPDLRHHRVENLYVSGASAFPSYSPAHPTLTIAALAIRLGRHLARV